MELMNPTYNNNKIITVPELRQPCQSGHVYRYNKIERLMAYSERLQTIIS